MLKVLLEVVHVIVLALEAVNLKVLLSKQTSELFNLSVELPFLISTHFNSLWNVLILLLDFDTTSDPSLDLEWLLFKVLELVHKLLVLR